MSNRFVLYYWPIPFRAQIIRYILAHAGLSWQEPDSDAVADFYRSEIPDQPVPFIGPPVLYDAEADLWLSQMSAIAAYLGEVLDLMPGTPAQDAMTHKILGDCTDVLQATTLNCGAAMWTQDGWGDFARDRFPRWLQVFEDLGRRHGLTADAGTLLGTPEPGVADLACAALWVTMIDKLARLEGIVTRHAPNVLALSRRVAAEPAIAELRSDQTARWGDIWCAGQIEASLRSVLDAWRDPGTVTH